MVPINRHHVAKAALALVCLCLSGVKAGAGANLDNSLFAQSAARILKNEFHDPGISYLLIDTRTGLLLALQWEDPENPVPTGSLVKPFTAIAYGERHGFDFPTYYCKGTAGGCWFPRGHRDSGIEAAIANSCNAYFRMLTAGMTGEDLAGTAQRFGLDVPPLSLSAAGLYGLGNEWSVSPLHLARAYLELGRQRGQPGVRQVLAGMIDSARFGTGSAVGRELKHWRALVKTGTAPCTHAHRAPGDGFTVALVPAEQPRLLLLVRVHGVPGSKAACIAGRMLSRLEE